MTKATFQSVERHLFASFPRTPKGKLNWQARDTQGGKKLQEIHGTNVLDHPSICFHEKKNRAGTHLLRERQGSHASIGATAAGPSRGHAVDSIDS